MDIFIVLPLIFATLFIGLFGIGAIIGITTLGLKKNRNLASRYSTYNSSVEV